MPELDQERIRFIEQLHEVFLINKGYGAFAYINITDVIDLFDQFSKSDEPSDLFIRRYVRSI